MIKIPFIAYHIIKSLKRDQQRSSPEFTLITWSRTSIIFPLMKSYLVTLYNGLKQIPVYISDYIFGYKIGEFVLTRKLPKHNCPTVKPVMNNKSKSGKTMSNKV